MPQPDVVSAALWRPFPLVALRVKATIQRPAALQQLGAALNSVLIRRSRNGGDTGTMGNNATAHSSWIWLFNTPLRCSDRGILCRWVRRSKCGPAINLFRDCR
jgi:hypothetical protein